MTKTRVQRGPFHDALSATGRSSEIPADADLFGWLIGSWNLDVRHYLVDVSARGIKAEAHFAWVLEGRAVQDVWIMPTRDDRSAPPEKTLNLYGTTLRIWDASLKAWRISWFNPATGGRNELVGRRHGTDIVQVGSHTMGRPSAGASPTSPPNRSGGRAKCSNPMERRGGSRESSWQRGHAEGRSGQRIT
jgi:hypothetical protein